MTQPGSRRRTWAACLLLTVAVGAVFWPALRCGFINYDDGIYVTENPHIQGGLTWAGLRWAFTATNGGYWLPLTWLSHMADYQLYQLRPAGHHLSSLSWHAANAVLLFLFLQQTTGAFWLSVVAGAFFGLHPLRVESVVWVAERKDVLSTCFWILAMWSYARYAGELEAARDRRRYFYAAALAFFTLGLMAKPMLVTLPFVLLLLDAWPLGRWRVGESFPPRLLVEKVPFFILALVFSAATYLAQDKFGAVKSFARYSFAQRLGNVPVSYARYLGKIFWPENLAIFYPPRRWPMWEVGAATALLIIIGGGALWQRRARPYLWVGWFWFLGTLAPTIGLVQSGEQAMADRFSYVPCVGILIMVVWGAHDLAKNRPALREGLILGSGLVICACAMLTFRQIRFWMDTDTVFAHALEATGRNYLASYNLGCSALARRDYPKAREYFEESLFPYEEDITWPNPAPAQNNLGYVLLQQGHVTQAVEHFETALATRTSDPLVYYNMGCAFLTNHQPDVAIESFQRGLALDPAAPEINYSMGESWLEVGRPAEAAPFLERALQRRPGFALAHEKLADALVGQGKVGEGVSHYRQARELALAQGSRALASAAEARLSQYENNPAAPAAGGAAAK
jgi:protein O-mannosyl-transferase